jgi:parallel beta-helix repeat protein
MARVEIPAPGDLIMDEDGTVQANVTVSLKLAGTSTDVTHYSALTGGTSTTGGLKSGSDGTIVDGSGNRRYVDSGVAMDLLIDGRTRQIEPLSASVEARFLHRPINLGDAPYSIDPASVVQNHGQIIQDGLTAAGASTYFSEVELPVGTYTTSQQINQPSNVTLIGHGASTVIKAAAATNISIFAAGSKSNVHWRDLTVDGNQTNVTGGNPFNLIGTSDFSLRNVRIQNGYNSGIIVSGCSDGEITGGVIKSCGNATAFAASGGHGVALADASFRIKVSTRILDCYSSGVNVSDTYQSTVTGCVIRDAVAVDTGYGGVRFSNGAAGNTASGNTIQNKSRGIFFSSLLSVQRNTATGNTIEGCTKNGILVETSSYNTITGNTIKNCCTNGTADGAIRLTATATYNQVNGNTIVDDRVTKLHAYGIREDTSSDYNTIGTNTIDGFLTLAITVVGANGKISPQTTSATTTIASAATLAPRDHSNTWLVTGGTNITTLSATTWFGRELTLIFDTAGATFQNNANVKLAGGVDLMRMVGMVLRLIWDGTAWNEVSRSQNFLSGTVTWDPASLATSGTSTKTITVSRAAVGDAVAIGFDQPLQGMMLTAFVSATNVVTAVLFNPTAGAIDLASGTLRADVFKY